MPAQNTRADSLREYLTGAASAGGSQSNPNASFGHFRSSTEAALYGITFTGSITGVVVNYASGGNAEGDGTLTAIDSTHLSWTPPGAMFPGPSVVFSGTQTLILEGNGVPGQYLRVTGTTPFSVNNCTVTLTTLYGDVFSFPDVTIAQATSGISQYRATIIQNEASDDVTNFQRCIVPIGTHQVSDVHQLSGSGSGTITTSGSFADWPAAGWCQVRNSGGTLKEVVYYTSRTGTVLTVPSAGRALLGTSATAGAASDLIYAVPGVAIALDTAGLQASGSSIQTIAGETTAPTSVSWNLGITPATGIQEVTFTAGDALGVWYWRHVPAGAIADPTTEPTYETVFDAA